MLKLQFIGSGLAIWSFAVIFSGFGAIVLNYFTKPVLRAPLKLIATLGYFAGMGIFLGSWRIQAIALKSASMGFWGTTLLFLIILFFHRDQVSALVVLAKTSWKSLIFSYTWVVFCHIFCGVFWSRDFYSNPYSTMGSGHSPRYANIALQILSSDHIPSLGQNYGQSMLAMIPTYLVGTKTPLVGLNIWLSLSIAILGLLTFSLFRWMKVTTWGAILGSAIILVGNTALMKRHVYILDSGSPFLVTGYTDTIFCLGSYVAFFYFFLQWKNRPIFYDWILRGLILLCFGLSWTMSAPQNLVVGIGVVTCIGLLKTQGFGRLWKSEGNPAALSNSLNEWFVLGFLLIAVFLGVFTGGMFSSSKYRDQVSIPGLQTVSQNGGKAITYLPTVPFYVGSYFGWEPGWKINKEKSGKKGEGGFSIHDLWSSLRQAVKLIFYPLIGILVLALSTFWQRLRITSDVVPVIKALWIIGFLSLSGGFLLSFPISIFGLKWELSRFSTVGFYLGLTSLILGVHNITIKRSRILGYCILITTLFFSSYGPIHSIGEIVRYELTNFQTLWQKYRALAEYRQVHS